MTLSFAGGLFISGKNAAVRGQTGVNLCHGIVVGAIHGLQFHELMADGLEMSFRRKVDGGMWQKITIFEQCEIRTSSSKP